MDDAELETEFVHAVREGALQRIDSILHRCPQYIDRQLTHTTDERPEIVCLRPCR